MVKLNKIYTRTGDDGTTGLVDGSRAPKHSARMVAVGDVDEANSAIGLAAAALGETDRADALFRIQNDLFDLGADLATPAGEGEDFEPSDMVLRVVAGQVAWLEQAIDAATAQLEPLTSSSGARNRAPGRTVGGRAFERGRGQSPGARLYQPPLGLSLRRRAPCQ